jgi:hypothetical protein
MTEAARDGEPTGFAAIARAYLRPDMADTRRLLAELHLASRRDDRLAALLEGWHRAEAERLAARLAPEGDPAATTKALFLLLLGLCHLDDLAAVDADPAAVADRVAALATSLER